MEPRARAARRRRWVIAGAVVALVIGLMFWLSPGEVQITQLASPAPPRAVESAPAHPPAAAPRAAVAEAPRATEVPIRPAPAVIDEIIVEKPVVCEGEENLITVKAHTVDGNDAFLHYTTAGVVGRSVPLRGYLRGDGEPFSPTVSVFTRNNVVATAPVPRYEVKRCREARSAYLEWRASPNAVAEYEFRAVVSSMDDTKPFTPIQYAWSFGDGKEELTTVPRAVHDYGDLPQATEFAQLLVSVTVVSLEGESVVGRTALQVLNQAFDSRLEGRVLLLTQPDPRFPVLGSDGFVRQKVRIWHKEEQAIEIDQVTMSRTLRSGATEPARDVDPVDLLGETDIPPGKSLRPTFAYDFKSNPDVNLVSYRIEGHSASGLPAVGNVSIMRPSERPTPQNSVPVTDPALEAKIKLAMKLLGKDVVTDGDLLRLEWEGRLTVPAAP